MNNSPNPTPSVTEKLKPCPFCGSGDICFDDAAMGHSRIFCGGCNLSTGDFPDDDAAEKWWNTRAAPQHTGLTCAYCGAVNLAEGRCLMRGSKQPADTGLTDVKRRQRVIDALWALRTDHLPSMEEIANAAIAAAQQPVCADVKRLLREARSYVEQAGLRHHDVSGLLAEIDAALLVSDRSGVEERYRKTLEWIASCGEYEYGSTGPRSTKARTTLDTEGKNSRGIDQHPHAARQS